jgi:hypothetical protein
MPDAQTSHIEDAPATIVARVYGSLDASGEAALVTLQQVTVVVAYDDLYEQILDASDSTALANAFDVSGNGESFTVTLAASGAARVAFEDVLARNMASALCTDYNSNGDISGEDAPTGLGLNLKDTLHGSIVNNFKRVFTDSLPNLLQSNWEVTNAVGYAAGAADMAGKLNPAECEILAQQLPESNYVLYMDLSENTEIKALPLKAGDSIIFVFNVAESAQAVMSKDDGLNADTGATAVPAGQGGASPYGTTQQSVTYTAGTRVVAFKFTVQNAAQDGGKLDNLTGVSA